MEGLNRESQRGRQRVRPGYSRCHCRYGSIFQTERKSGQRRVYGLHNVEPGLTGIVETYFVIQLQVVYLYITRSYLRFNLMNIKLTWFKKMAKRLLECE